MHIYSNIYKFRNSFFDFDSSKPNSSCHPLFEPPVNLGHISVITLFTLYGCYLFTYLCPILAQEKLKDISRLFLYFQDINVH